MGGVSPQLSDGEWKVMNAVWDHGPATARTVHDAVADTGWAYTTVKTMLDRLVEKGALAVTHGGRRDVYRSRLTRGRARRSAVRALVEKAFGGALGPMMHFVLSDQRLTERERAELARLIGERDR